MACLYDGHDPAVFGFDGERPGRDDGVHGMSSLCAPENDSRFIGLVTAWASWPRPAPPSPEDPSRALVRVGKAEVNEQPRQSPRAGLRVTRFEIPHYPKLDEHRYDRPRIGVLIVRAELSEPSYSYLIAFRPEGTDELRDPDDENMRPPKNRQPGYPAPSRTDDRYQFAEGAGRYASALVASRGAAAGLPRLEATIRAAGLGGGAALRARGRLARRRAGSGTPLYWRGQRGAERVPRPALPTIRPQCWRAGCRSRPGIDAVTLEAFPVEPASAP